MRRWLRRWLGMDELELQVERSEKNLYAKVDLLKKKWDEVRNEGIIGVDLGIKDAQLVILQYNRATRGVRAIASEDIKDPMYHQLIRQLRHLVKEYNGRVLVIDRPKGIADIELRVWNGLNAKELVHDDRRREKKVSEEDGLQSKDA